MEQMLETLAVELSKLGVKGSELDYRLGCDKSGVYVDVYKKEGVDDRDIIKVVSYYSKFEPDVLVISKDMIAFKLSAALDLGSHVRSVGMYKKGESYMAYTALEFNNETLEVTNKIISREANATYELSKVIGDKTLITITGVDVSSAFKNI